MHRYVEFAVVLLLLNCLRCCILVYCNAVCNFLRCVMCCVQYCLAVCTSLRYVMLCFVHYNYVCVMFVLLYNLGYSVCNVELCVVLYCVYHWLNAPVRFPLQHGLHCIACVLCALCALCVCVLFMLLSF